MFTGTYTAIVTPFKNGQLDAPALERLVRMQIKAGVDGIVPVGTTGESPTVDYEEHLEIIALTVKFCRGQGQSARRHRREFDQRGGLSDARGRENRRGRLVAGRAVLQQADAGRFVPAFPRNRAHDQTAHRALQHSGALRRRNRRRNRPAPGARMQKHHRHQGSRRQLRPGVAIARGARPEIRDFVRRRFAHAAVHGGRRGRRHQRGVQCRSARSGADGEPRSGAARSGRRRSCMRNFIRCSRICSSRRTRFPSRPRWR